MAGTAHGVLLHQFLHGLVAERLELDLHAVALNSLAGLRSCGDGADDACVCKRLPQLSRRFDGNRTKEVASAPLKAVGRSCRPLLTTASAVANPVLPVQPFTITGGCGAAMATAVCAMDGRARRRHAAGRLVLRREPANVCLPNADWD